jgi:xanthine dehydrogenase YagS FAD-binding subunit
VERPARLIDIHRLPLNIDEHESGVRIGAIISNSDAANHPLIRAH